MNRLKPVNRMSCTSGFQKEHLTVMESRWKRTRQRRDRKMAIRQFPQHLVTLLHGFTFCDNGNSARAIPLLSEKQPLQCNPQNAKIRQWIGRRALAWSSKVPSSIICHMWSVVSAGEENMPFIGSLQKNKQKKNTKNSGFLSSSLGKRTNTWKELWLVPIRA